ncbi:hypothetical protein LA080_006707 [Diaporthe eres]|nr:hypothetical protein LA080_006707 [Diaporthe eres]
MQSRGKTENTSLHRRFSGLLPIHHLISLTRSSVAAAEVGRGENDTYTRANPESSLDYVALPLVLGVMPIADRGSDDAYGAR